MDKIQIITIATGSYNKFKENFINTIDNFFPKYAKDLIVLTDSNDINDYHLCTETKVISERLENLIYPTILINKFLFIKSRLGEKYKYCFYFDIDTLFYKCKEDVWNFIEDKIEKNIIVSTHPFYRLRDDAKLWGLDKKQLLDFSFNLCIDKRRSCVIDEMKYPYIIASFIGGKIDLMRDFADKEIELTRKDLSRFPYGYYIPPFIDENYVNYIVNYGKYPIYAGDFNVIHKAENDEKLTQYVFMEQKNFGEKKERQ